MILDECHHAGDGLTWGDAIRNAFEPAPLRLSTTGTPFRSDKKEIPFVNYLIQDGRWVCQPDFSYQYGDALRDGVVRHVFFQTYDGDMSWLSGDAIISASFSDPLGTGRARERLRTAISPRANWLPEVLTAAHGNLVERRRTHNDAGGLAVCQDIRHAEQVARLLQGISTTPVTLVTSENEQSARLIDDFRYGRDEWIVAVKMLVKAWTSSDSVSVSMPATSQRSYFSTSGRAICSHDSGIRRAIRLVVYSQRADHCHLRQRLQEERNHVIEDDKDEILDEIYRQREFDKDRQKHLFSAISAFAEKDDIIHDASSFSVEELVQAAKISEEVGCPA